MNNSNLLYKIFKIKTKLAQALWHHDYDVPTYVAVVLELPDLILFAKIKEDLVPNDDPNLVFIGDYDESAETQFCVDLNRIYHCDKDFFDQNAKEISPDDMLETIDERSKILVLSKLAKLVQELNQTIEMIHVSWGKNHLSNQMNVQN